MTSAALAIAPITLLIAKMRLAWKRSAPPVTAKVSVPAMKPSCVAEISQPNAAVPIASCAIRPSAAPLGLNQREVPSHCASTTSATAPRCRLAAPADSVPDSGAALKRSGAVVECLRQIVDQIVGMLQPDRDTKEALRCLALGPFDRRAVLDQALDAAQAGRASED